MRNSKPCAKDLDGYKLLRPYHHVSVDMRQCDDKCADKCARSEICVRSCKRECVDPNRGKPWMIGIYNVELWMANTLEYQVMATCVSAAAGAPCPRPKGSRGGMCSGASNGACEAGMSLLFIHTPRARVACAPDLTRIVKTRNIAYYVRLFFCPWW